MHGKIAIALEKLYSLSCGFQTIRSEELSMNLPSPRRASFVAPCTLPDFGDISVTFPAMLQQQQKKTKLKERKRTLKYLSCGLITALALGETTNTTPYPAENRDIARKRPPLLEVGLCFASSS